MNLNLFDLIVFLMFSMTFILGYKKGAINIIFSFAVFGLGINFFIEDTMLGSILSDVKIYNKAIISAISVLLITMLHHFTMQAMKFSYSFHILNKNLGAFFMSVQTFLILIICYHQFYPQYYKKIPLIKGSISQKIAQETIKSQLFNDLIKGFKFSKKKFIK